MTRADHRAVIERRARDLRLAAMKPRPDSDWDEPDKIHEDNKQLWRAHARKQLHNERRATKTIAQAEGIDSAETPPDLCRTQARPMNTLEKLARALAARFFDEDYDCGPISNRQAYIDEAWTGFVGDARTVLEALLEPSEGMIDAPRGLIMYFNSPPGESYPLGSHAKSGGYGESYAHLLTDREKRMHSFPKAHQASLVFRAIIQAALDGK